MGLKIRINWGNVVGKILGGESPEQIATDAVTKSVEKTVAEDLPALRAHALELLVAGTSPEQILADVFGVTLPAKSGA